MLERDGAVKRKEGLFILMPEAALNDHLGEVLYRHLPGIEGDGFKMVREGNRLYLIGLTGRGCLYGLMDVTEQLADAGDLAGVRPKAVNPALGFRAIKFNLPWSPYRTGEATELHFDRCRDLGFWEEFLDMMVKNRFNALTLWNKHPFPYLIRSTNYPAACPFTLYSEGFLAPWPSGFDDEKSPFISIGELIRHETLDLQYLSIADYCRIRPQLAWRVSWTISGPDKHDNIKLYINNSEKYHQSSENSLSSLR